METKQKKIIVGVDFSESSRNAAKLGAEMARLHGSELILMFVVESLSPLATFLAADDYYDKKKTAATHGLEKMAERYRAEGTQVSLMFGKGKVWKEILRVANETLAEMILMGVRGDDVKDAGFVGSNVQHVIRQASCPVFTVDKEAALHAKKILLPVDKEFGIRELRAYLHRYASSFNPVVEVVSIATPNADKAELEAYLGKQKAALESTGIQNVQVTVIEGKYVSEAILGYAKDHGHEMIWMETHGRSGIGGLILGSVTEDVLAFSQVPVLSLRPERTSVVASYYSSNLPV